MDKQLSNLLPVIEGWLKLEEFSSFKIGITSNIEQRRYGYESREGVQLFEIANGNTEIIKAAESDLINHFLNSSLKEKCENEPNTGGIGNVTDANTLYIAVEYAHGTISKEDLHVPFNDIIPVQL